MNIKAKMNDEEIIKVTEELEDCRQLLQEAIRALESSDISTAVQKVWAVKDRLSDPR